MFKNKKIVIILIILFVLCCSLFVSCKKSQKVDITHTETYQVVKTGELVTLPELFSVNNKGEKVTADIKVTAPNGDKINLTNNTFTANANGKYTVIYSSKISNDFTYYVYAYADGLEYDANFPNGKPIINAEWDESFILPKCNFTSRVTGETVSPKIRVVYGGQTTEILLNAYIPKNLGKHIVEYYYGNTVETFEFDCVVTKPPKVYLITNASVVYGQECLLPYESISYPTTDYQITKAVYRENDKTNPVELSRNRFMVDASRYFTYVITVTYNQNGETKTYNQEFALERQKDAKLDMISAYLDGDTVKWDDRTALYNEYENYYKVIGYEISIDNGNTFIKLDKSVNSYKLNTQKFCSIIVREVRENEDASVAKSEKLFYDCTLTGNIISSYDDEGYIALSTIGSYSDEGWIYNAQHNLLSSVGAYHGRDGVFSMSTSEYAGLKIDFAKKLNVKANGLICLDMYYSPTNGNSSDASFAPYGEDSFGVSLKEFGLVENQWCKVYLKVGENLGLNNSDILKGIELYISNGAGLYIDQVCYYGSEQEIVDLVLSDKQKQTELINFNNSISAYFVKLGAFELYFGNESCLTKTVLTEGYAESDGGVLKVACPEYCGVDVRFPNTVTVNDRLYITFNVYATTDWFRMGKYNVNDYGLDFSGKVKLNQWTSFTISPYELGYENGDVLEGFSAYVSGKNKQGDAVYFDKVTYYFKQDITAEKFFESDSELANYNYLEYGDYVNSKDNAVNNKILTDGYDGSSSGVLKLESKDGGVATLTLPRKYKIEDVNKYLNFRIYSTTSYKILFKNYGNDLRGVDYSNFASWIEISLSFKELGYSSGDTVDKVNIYLEKGGGRKFVLIDTITAGDKTESPYLVDFDTKACETLVAKSQLKYNNNLAGNAPHNVYWAAQNNAGWIAQNKITYSSSVSDGKLNVVYSQWGNVSIRFLKSLEVTDELIITMNITTSVQQLSANKYGDDGIGVDISSLVSVGKENLVKIYALDLGYEEGEIINGIDLYLGRENYTGKNYTFSVDYISYEYSESYNKVFDDLGEKELANFNSERYLSYLFNTGAKWNNNIPDANKDPKNNYSYFPIASSPQTAVIEDGNLFVNYTNYGNIGIKFIKPVEVIGEKALMLTFKVKLSAATFRVSKFGTDDLGVNLSGLVTKTNDWVLVSLTAFDLGYVAGDFVDGVDLYLHASAGKMYLDSITYDYVVVEDLKAGLEENELSNFNSDGYLRYTSNTGAKWNSNIPNPNSDAKNCYSYYPVSSAPQITSVENGILKVNYTNYGNIGINFVRSIEVKSGYKLNLTFRVKLSQPTFRVSKLGADSIGENLSSLVTTNEWINITVSALSLGYVNGDVIEGLDFYLHPAAGTMELDSITFEYVEQEKPWEDATEHDFGLADGEYYFKENL